MLDTVFITRKIKLIQEEISKLEDLSQYTFAEISEDFLKRYSVERALEKIIMRAIDVNQHIISEIGTGAEIIRGYEDTFYALSKLGLYKENFAKEIAPSAGLRNRIVHEYNDTKDEIIYESVKDAISQYAKYCKFILNFLKKNK